MFYSVFGFFLQKNPYHQYTEITAKIKGDMKHTNCTLH